MAELARTPGPLRQMFQLIDMAPEPHDSVVAEALATWHERRGTELTPQARDLRGDANAAVRAGSFLASALAGRTDFALSQVGEEAARCLGLSPAEHRLSAATQLRIAARLRRLFTLVLDYGEPVLGRFGEVHGHAGPCEMEVLAAPIILEGGDTGVFCALSSGGGH
ncbi:hypothetical protein GCM10009087_00990 [Sphingomonas oligophenolica]|uniref:GAF domain-containing protein n=1 Tax=Sphingomonas oligophenolica TaxID=301154 RepID=A0ABU9Y190_9SPHN